MLNLTGYPVSLSGYPDSLVSPPRYLDFMADARIIDFQSFRFKRELEHQNTYDTLLSIAYLYDDLVSKGSEKPVIDLALFVDSPLEDVAQLVCDAMDDRYLTIPKKGTFGGRLSKRGRYLFDKRERNT